MKLSHTLRKWLAGWLVLCLCLSVAMGAEEKQTEKTVTQKTAAGEASADAKGKTAADPESAGISDEDLDRILKYLAQSPSHRNRSLGEKLNTLKDRDPQQLSAVLTARMARMLLDEIERREANPDLFDQKEMQRQLQQDIYALAKRIRSGDEKESEKLAKRLHRLLEQEYEARVRIRELELAELEGRINTLKDELEKQKSVKGHFIQDRLRRLTAVPDKDKDAGEKGQANPSQQASGKNEFKNSASSPPAKKQ